MSQAIGYAAKHSFSSLKPLSFERREPGPRDVEIDVLFCGVCHSDIHQVKNEWHNTVYPCLPGHEIVGRVARVGAEVTRHQAGEVVGVGCMVDSCGACASCREGLEQYCESERGFLGTYNGPIKPDGSNTFGGYSNKVVVKESFVLKIPHGIELSRAAPILCAGVTTYSPMKRWKVSPGQSVGVIGFGGLGHLATQLAKAMGAKVTVFTRTEAKREDALRLGASAVVLSTDAAAMKQQAEKHHFLLSTIPQKNDINPYVETLRRDGVLTVVGQIGPFAKPTDNQPAVMRRLSVAGSLIGGIAETQEVLDFCAKHGIGAQTEVIDIEQVNDIFSKVEKGEVRYRAVIDLATLKA